MKILIEFDVEIDGECSEEQAKKAFNKGFEPISYGIDSQQIDGSDDYVLLISGWEVK